MRRNAVCSNVFSLVSESAARLRLKSWSSFVNSRSMSTPLLTELWISVNSALSWLYFSLLRPSLSICCRKIVWKFSKSVILVSSWSIRSPFKASVIPSGIWLSLNCLLPKRFFSSTAPELCCRASFLVSDRIPWYSLSCCCKEFNRVNCSMRYFSWLTEIPARVDNKFWYISIVEAKSSLAEPWALFCCCPGSATAEFGPVGTRIFSAGKSNPANW